MMRRVEGRRRREQVAKVAGPGGSLCAMEEGGVGRRPASGPRREERPEVARSPEEEKKKGEQECRRREEGLDRALRGSFPCSDPMPFTASAGGSLG